jgi:glyceraldehyde 3-phosphate dehydrogenase
VPTPNVSMIDLVVCLQKTAEIDNLREIFKKAAANEYHGVLAYTDDPIVSSDIIGDEHSSIVDGEFLTKIDNDMIKVLAWYDNEWGYSCRLKDLIVKISSY